jgi:hypothetical protein
VKGAKVCIVRLPDVISGGKTGADDFLRIAGAQAFRAIRDAAPMWSATETSVTLDITRLADVQSEPVPWLWKKYLAFGMLCMISGDPGAAKTWIVLAIAASLSQGRIPYSNERGEPMHTLYLSHENSPQYVVRPRFDSLGGNPKYFHILKSIITMQDIPTLRAALLRTGAKLLIIDPLQSFLGANVDAHRSNETRPVLDGLIKLAEELGVCVLIVRHLAKSSGGRALHKGLGSIDITGAVRIELLAGSEADKPNSRALVQIKNNLGEFAPSLAFIIEGQDEKSRLVWKGESELRAADLLAPESTTSRSGQDRAAEYVKEQLAGGPKPISALITSEFSERMLQRAAKLIGVDRKRETARGAVVWALRGNSGRVTQ